MDVPAKLKTRFGLIESNYSQNWGFAERNSFM